MGSRSGRCVASGNQRCDRGKAMGEQLAEFVIHEVRRSDDVGDELTFVQRVEGGYGHASCARHQLLDAAARVHDEAEALNHPAA